MRPSLVAVAVDGCRGLAARNIRFLTRHHAAVVAASLLLTVMSVVVLAARFKVSSDIADLLPAGHRSVRDHDIVRQRVGSPEFVEVVMRTTEPEPDVLAVASGVHRGFRSRIARIRQQGSAVVLLMETPLPGGSDEAGHVEFIVERGRKRQVIQEVLAAYLVSDDGQTLTLNGLADVDRDKLLVGVRQGDENGDGVFSMDQAKLALETIGRELEKSSNIDYVFHTFHLDFFKDNRLLYVPVSDIIRLKCCVREKQSEAVRREFSVSVGHGAAGPKDDDEDGFGKPELRKEDLDPECEARFKDRPACGNSRERAGVETFERSVEDLPTHMVSKAGYLCFLVHPVRPSTDFDFNRAVQAEILATITRVIESDLERVGRHFVPGGVELGGGYRNRLNEVKRIKRDIFSTTAYTTMALLLLLVAYFRQLRALAMVLGPLVMGVTWTLAVAFLYVVHLNLITAFIFAVLLGLGVDIGIHNNMIALPVAVGIGIDNAVHLYHRYIEEGSGHVLDVVRNTGPPMFLSTLTTTIGFSGLIFTQHLGLRSIGVLAVLAVASTFLVAITFMPAMLVVLEAVRGVLDRRRRTAATS